MTHDETPGALPPPAPETLIEPLLADLLYPSESDEPVEVVRCPLRQSEPLSVRQLADWLNLSAEVRVEEVPEDWFWAPVTSTEDWYDAAERQRADTFERLRQQLSQLLTERQVFRVGDTEVTVYLLGRTASGDRMGVQTMVVET